jgi:hypothetical protein
MRREIGFGRSITEWLEYESGRVQQSRHVKTGGNVYALDSEELERPSHPIGFAQREPWGEAAWTARDLLGVNDG